MFCTKCGYKMSDTAKFCQKCGTRVSAANLAATAKMIARHAGSPGRNVLAMCPSCKTVITVNPAFKIVRCSKCNAGTPTQAAIRFYASSTNPSTAGKAVSASAPAVKAPSAFPHAAAIKEAPAPEKAKPVDAAVVKVKEEVVKNEPEVTIKKVVPIAPIKETIEEVVKNDPEDTAKKVVPAAPVKEAAEEVTSAPEVPVVPSVPENTDNTDESEMTKPVVRTALLVGEEIEFGTKDDKKIRWKVLEVSEDSALIISCEAVCSMAYHLPGGDITWKDCETRKWLNGEFLETCFASDESSRIITSDDLLNENNPVYNTPGGETTSDKVFLLSISEAEKYFDDITSRALGYYWWLRTPGSNSANASYVDGSGRISTCGTMVVNYFGKHGVRPAMRVKI